MAALFCSVRLSRLSIIPLFVLVTSLPAASPEQSVSTSRQFIVYGTRVPVRGAICDLAERTKRELLTLLDERDNWATPIVINAQYARANLPEKPRLAVNVGQTGFGLKLQLDLLIDSEIAAPEVRRELLRALLIEMMYRAQSNVAPGTVYAAPPDWLLDGVPAPQSDLPRERAANLLALPVMAGTVLPLEKFLEQRPSLLDASGRLLYRAYAAALVEWLVRLPDGPRHLAAYISDLPFASGEPVGQLRKHFPALEEDTEKPWQKQVARFSARQPYELLSNAETERILKEKLRIEVRDRSGATSWELKDFPSFVNERSARTALSFLAQDLQALTLQANPLFAPIVAEYAQVSRLLARGRTGGVSKRIERLERTRRSLASQIQGIDDYLNWFEATSLPGPSGAFAGYLKAAESANRPERSRRDPISVYLDAIETQFQN